MRKLGIKLNAKQIARIGIIAGLYAVLTMCIPILSYGQFQIRISECLTILPLFYPETVVGLFIGCLISNILGNGPLDIIFGSLATLVAGILTCIIGKVIKNKIARLIVGGLPPVIINAIVVPFTYLVITDLSELYFLNALYILIGQALSVYILGTLLYFSVDKYEKKFVCIDEEKPDE